MEVNILQGKSEDRDFGARNEERIPLSLKSSRITNCLAIESHTLGLKHLFFVIIDNDNRYIGL